MSALVRKSAFVTTFIRKFRGGSQPVLVQASDGFRYVVKFRNNPQGPNVPFNEAIGTELYKAAGLPVPLWKQLNVTEAFLNQNPQCWIDTVDGKVKPESGLCFASRYLGQENSRAWQILPGSSYSRIQNRDDFFLAWILDICAGQTHDRQALFKEHPDGHHAIFIDHSHMFFGASGESNRPDYRAAAYLDTRIYELKRADWTFRARAMLDLDLDRLCRRSQQLPIEWLTDTGLRGFADCLNALADTKALRNIVELIADFPSQKDQREFLEPERFRTCPDWLLRAGVQGA